MYVTDLSHEALPDGSLPLTELASEPTACPAGTRRFVRAAAARLHATAESGGGQIASQTQRLHLSAQRREHDRFSDHAGGCRLQLLEVADDENRTTHLLGSPFKFSKHGESGLAFSEVLPGIAKHADDIAVIRSMFTEHRNHEQAIWMANTGLTVSGRPNIGSWVAKDRRINKWRHQSDDRGEPGAVRPRVLRRKVRGLTANGTDFRNPQRQQGSVASPQHAESLAHAFRSCAVWVLLADNPKGSQQLAGG